MSSIPARVIAEETFFQVAQEKPTNPVKAPAVNKPSENFTSTPIQGKDCPRKKSTRHGYKMNEDGSCPIPGCSYICKSKKRSTFLMHIQSKHKRECGVAENTYQCPRCDKICMTRSILNNHLSEVHDKTPRAYLWKCLEPECGAVHKTKGSLASHYVTRHIGKKASACITDGGLCVICGENRECKTAASNVYHYAVCSGTINAINARAKDHKIINYQE